MSEPVTPAQIDIRARYFYLLCVLIFAIRFASSSLFSQLSQPVLIDPGTNYAYWLFHWLGIPYLTTHSVIWSAVLDILLFLLPVIASTVSSRLIFAFLFTVIVATYQITYSTYSGHHGNSLAGVLILSIPFWFGPGRRFAFLWEAARYYFIFIFASSALSEIFRGELWDGSRIASILMTQHAQAIYEYPNSLLTHFHSYLIVHTWIARVVLLFGTALGLSFSVGFFTKKYDKLYMVLFTAFFALNYLVMQIFDVEILIFFLVLLDWDKIEMGRGQRRRA